MRPGSRDAAGRPPSSAIGQIRPEPAPARTDMPPAKTKPDRKRPERRSERFGAPTVGNPAKPLFVL
ncbi:hypothetical protein DIE18_18860 [Burkholderia sp. Bp9125]|nr:hypothetical protein DIE18_18860 [Burkholderia sp. Bp9125]